MQSSLTHLAPALLKSHFNVHVVTPITGARVNKALPFPRHMAVYTFVSYFSILGGNKVNGTLPMKIYHSAVCEQDTGQCLSERASEQLGHKLSCLSDHPMHPRQGSELKSLSSAGRAPLCKGHTSYFMAGGSATDSRVVLGGWRCVAASASCGRRRVQVYGLVSPYTQL